MREPPLPMSEAARRAGPPPVSPPEHRLRVGAIVCGIILWAFYLSGVPGRFAQDFPQFYALARFALEGRVDDLQSGPALSQAATRLATPAVEWVLVPIYGPQVALALAPLGALPYKAAETTWLLLSACLYVFAVRHLLRDCVHLQRHTATVWLLALAAPLFFELMWYGQLSMVALALMVVGLSAWHQGRLFQAGLAFGALAYKPQYGLAVAVIAMATGSLGVIAGALVTGLGQLLVAWTFAGTSVMHRYVETLLAAPRSLDLLQSRAYMMQSLLPLAQWLPGTLLPITAYAAASGLVLAVSYRIWVTRSAPWQLQRAAVVLASLLVSPHLYVYDLVLTAPVFVWIADWALMERTTGQRQARRLFWSLVPLYAWPVLGLVCTYYITFNFGPIVLLWALAVVASIVRDKVKEGHNAPML